MSTSEVDRDWWRGAVIYQIYPRSFQDSNGDGVGDLRGMLTRLPHIARLGADAIWISPFFKSPMKDYGYDVADFTDVDPIFGTIEDFDAVVAESHRLGLKVMIDLVISHTSDEHPWFKESRSSRNKETNPRSDWYVWSDPKPDGTPPNNWLSIFGGSAWEWDSRREQYYLHNFLVSQPDLNFHNPDVQDALLTATRFWLDRGVDGFRLDTINFYFHSKGLESNPPLAPEDRNDSAAPSVNPYNYQDHIFDKNQPENLAFLARFRALLDEYPATAAVGEVGDAQRSMELVTQYTAGTTGVHMCYLFDFLSGEKLTSARVRSIIEGFEAVGRDSWCCWALSNHDTTRVASRWASDEPDPAAHAKLVAAMLMSSRGSYCIYQGEELGLPEVDLAFEDLQDPYGIRFWPEFKGRDGCRTPVAWDSNLANAGFSEAKPWLPVPAEHVGLSVNTQEGEGNSMMEHYRRMLKFRATHPVLVKGSVEFVDTEGSLVAFKRSYGGETVLCLFNLGVEDVSFPLGELAPIELKGHGYVGVTEQGKIKLGPYQAWFGQLA